MEQFIPVIISSAVAGVLVLVAAVLSRLRPSGSLATLPAIAVATSFLLAMRIQIGSEMQILPPAEGWRWIFWVGMIGAWGTIFDLLIGGSRCMRVLHWIPRVILAVVLLASRRMQAAWSASESTMWVGSISIYILVLAYLSDWINQKVSSRTMLLGWGMTIGAAAGMIVLSGKFQQYSNLAIILGVAVGVLFILSLIVKSFRTDFSVWMVLSLLLVLLIAGSSDPWHASLPIQPMMLLLAAPLASLLALPLAKKSWWWGGVVVVIVTSILLAKPGFDAYQQYLELREEGYAP